MPEEARIIPERVIARFWSKVNKHGPAPDHAPYLGNCWLWEGSLFSRPRGDHRYGAFWFNHQNRPAHVFSWELENGLLPDGKHPDHLCRVRACVRPSHLEPVDTRTNLLRSPITLASINAAKTHCQKGHPYVPGTRKCAICGKESSAERYQKKRALLGMEVGLPTGSRAHCPRGHPYDDQNTYYGKGKNGRMYRRCKQCARDRQQISTTKPWSRRTGQIWR
jgi:hypothetical protein